LVTIVFAREPTSPGQPGKHAPTATNAEATFNTGSNTLSWTWQLAGDYNQNGEVAVDDLIPLAMYFGESAPFTPIEEVVNGDGNDLIELADINPINANLLSAVDSWAIYSGSALEYPNFGDLVGTLGFGSFLGDPAAERISFETLIGDPQPDAFYWLRPVYQGLQGTESNATGG
jgi:hypothetical protein